MTVFGFGKHLSRQRKMLSRTVQMFRIWRQCGLGKSKVDKVTARFRPEKGIGVLGAKTQTVVTGGFCRSEVERVAVSLAQPTQGNPEVVLRDGPVHRCRLDGLDGQRGLMGFDGLMQAGGAAVADPSFLKSGAEVVLRCSPVLPVFLLGMKIAQGG